MLIEWFKKAGFSLVDKFALNNHTNHKELNRYFNTDNYYVVSLVSSNILPRGGGPNLPNHWVVWTSLLRSGKNAVDLNTKLTDIVHLAVFSWGENNWPIQPNLPLNKFMFYHLINSCFTTKPLLL
ncbi:hypothetical protein LP114_11925 [Moraxella bovis]|uniref:hypothetical protein n=1 Tax=Moraxella bovis TaxID=476 RepID=UPI0022275C1C|nr:hypothetical protein [Moraxella bovis]UYZ89105.1 hypothetical protein LP114_11925 [Moraxella bovis]UYZ95804.1 hypothetical protein LP121_04390 [Moraxella bovis]